MKWSEVAVDYDEGTTITDLKTGRVYTEEAAREQPAEIRRRLVNKPNKVGCYVMTMDEVRELI